MSILSPLIMLLALKIPEILWSLLASGLESIHIFCIPHTTYHFDMHKQVLFPPAL